MSATVIPARENQEAYLLEYAARRDELPGGARLRGIRQAAIERFSRLGFPTTHQEEWKYTNLAPFLKTPYEAAPASSGGAVPLQRGPGRLRLTFVNGRFAPELSRLPSTPGLRLASFGNGGEFEERAGSCAAFEDNALVALNTALFEDGAYVEIASGAVIETPVELLFLTTADSKPVVSYPRVLIVAGRDSQAQIVETYRGFGGAPYFTNAVTEVLAGDGAVLEHYKLQEEHAGALHFGMLAARQGASSSFVSHNIALGAALARNEIAAVLEGEGADCNLNGLYLATGTQHVDNYTTLDHAKPHATSHELYKGILDGKGQGVFHGRIIVRPDAQKTDAIQRNKNLLLSETATINTKPQLEIYADDVKCTHGATVGQVDPDAVFYLRSRGVALEEARRLLTYAFTSEMTARMKVAAVREHLDTALFARLSGGRR
jgi:Fe-S cluster assembly protein SufD